MPPIKHARTSVLDMAYEDSGPADGVPVVLMHGFPYDPRGYDRVVPLLTAQGCRTIVPYLRGYGPTRFLSKDTMRTGEQAALGNDLNELMDALAIERAVLCGYDWGGRACCIVAALWPERVIGLVTGGGYNVHDVAGSAKPADAAQEHRAWYQYYFCTPRGIAGLTENRRGIAKLLWQLWLVGEPFDAALFEKSAASFDNPDFVDVVIHSYRVRYGYVAGDPRLPGSNGSSPQSRQSPCRRSCCMARRTASRRRSRPKTIGSISPGRISAGWCRVPAMHCRRMRRKRWRMRCWNSFATRAPEGYFGVTLPNRRDAPSFARVVNQLKGGDPVSHCHSPITAGWISASGVCS